MSWLKRIVGSAWMGGCSALMFVVGLGILAGPWWNPGRPTSFEEAAIPPLSRSEIEPQVLQHIGEFETSSGRILQQRGATKPQRGRAYGELGRIYCVYRLWEQASVALANATSLDRDSFEWPYLLAHACLYTPDLPRAQSAMTEAQRRLPGDASGKAEDHLAAACFLADIAQKLGQNSEVNQQLETALKIHPQCVYALLMRGKQFSDENRHEEAIRDLELAVSRQPRSKALRTALSAAFRRQGNLKKAAEWVVNSTGTDWRPVNIPEARMILLRQQSRSSRRFHRAGTQLMDQGRFLAAMNEFSAGLAAYPDSVPLLSARAECYDELEKFDEALADLDRVEELQPADESFRSYRLRIKVRIPSERENALQEAEAWAKEAPDSKFACATRAGCLMELGRPEEALAQWRDLRTVDEEWMLPPIRILECLGRMRDFQQLHREFGEILTTSPQNGLLQLYHARLLACGPIPEHRDPQKALQILEGLLKDRATAVFLETQAAALYAMGERAAATAAIEQALEIAGQQAAPKVIRRMAALRRAMIAGLPFVEPWPLADPGQSPEVVVPGT